MRVTLPSGGWADLLDVEQLRGGHKRKVDHLMAGHLVATADGKLRIPRMGQVLLGVSELIITAVVTAWELPYAPGALLPRDNPPTAETEGGWLDVVSPRDLGKLEASVVAHRDELLEAPGAESTEPAVLPDGITPDPASPTQPQAGSAPDLRDATSAPQPTPNSAPGTTPTESGGGPTVSAGPPTLSTPSL